METPMTVVSDPAISPPLNALAPRPQRVGQPQLDTSPGTLDRPAFLMNCPFSYSTEQPNNAWMYDLDDAHRQVDRRRAMSQFARVYDRLASDAFVFLLPAPEQCRLQDLVFTANLGIVLRSEERRVGKGCRHR